MSKQEKHAYLEAIQRRYHKADRAGKARILDEFCAVFSYHRKYAIRLLGKKPGATARHPGRKPCTTPRRFLKPCAASGWHPIRCAARDWSSPFPCGYPTTKQSTENSTARTGPVC